MKLFPLGLRWWTALLMAVLLCAFDVVPAAAGLAASRTSGATTVASVRDAELLAVQRALENRVVAQKLRDYGVTPDEARLRVAALNDQDLHALATATRGLPSGGDVTGGVIALLVIIVLILVILKLLNRQVIVR